MSREAANALLKVLEEPSGDTLFFLVASHQAGILSTIISRVWHIKFWPLSQERVEKGLLDLEVPKKKAQEFASLAMGKPGLAVEWNKRPYSEVAKAIQDLERRQSILLGKLERQLPYAERIAEDADDSLTFLEEAEYFLEHLLRASRGVTSDTEAGSQHSVTEQRKIYHLLKAIDTARMHLESSPTSPKLILSSAFISGSLKE